jgi:DnaK suppressor protein
MVRMPAELRDRYGALLLQRRQSLLKDLEGLDEERGSEGQDVAGAPLHPGDLGTENSEYDLIRSCAESTTNELQEIDDALARLRDGTFGRCEDCDHPIPAARLDAIPYARLCIACKSQEEAA